MCELYQSVFIPTAMLNNLNVYVSLLKFIYVIHPFIAKSHSVIKKNNSTKNICSFQSHSFEISVYHFPVYSSISY